MGLDRPDPAAIRVGGRRERHPFRHPILDLGASVRAAQMVADDAFQDLARFLAVRLGDTFARNLGDDAGPPAAVAALWRPWRRSEEHTSELQSLMRISYAVFCLKKKKHQPSTHTRAYSHPTVH